MSAMGTEWDGEKKVGERWRVVSLSSSLWMEIERRKKDECWRRRFGGVLSKISAGRSPCGRKKERLAGRVG